MRILYNRYLPPVVHGLADYPGFFENRQTPGSERISSLTLKFKY